jgi:hypothetical protein
MDGRQLPCMRRQRHRTYATCVHRTAVYASHSIIPWPKSPTRRGQDQEADMQDADLTCAECPGGVVSNPMLPSEPSCMPPCFHTRIFKKPKQNIYSGKVNGRRPLPINSRCRNKNNARDEASIDRKQETVKTQDTS